MFFLVHQRAAHDAADFIDAVAELKRTIAQFKVPKHVRVVDALPRNAMGKVQKAALREAYKDIYRGA